MKKIKIDKERCKGCLLCLENCPIGVLEESRKINSRGMLVVNVKYPAKCTKCGLCAMVCPDSAITIDELNPRPASNVGYAPPDSNLR